MANPEQSEDSTRQPKGGEITPDTIVSFKLSIFFGIAITIAGAFFLIGTTYGTYKKTLDDLDKLDNKTNIQTQNSNLSDKKMDSILTIVKNVKP